MRPTEIIKTARVGYQDSGTGLVTGFGACKSMIHEITKCKMAKTKKSKGVIARESQTTYFIDFNFTHHQIRLERRNFDSKEISSSIDRVIEEWSRARRKDLGMEYFRAILLKWKRPIFFFIYLLFFLILKITLILWFVMSFAPIFSNNESWPSIIITY